VRDAFAGVSPASVMGNTFSNNYSAAYDACQADPSTCTSLIESNTLLAGTLPTEFGRLTALTYLDVSENYGNGVTEGGSTGSIGVTGTLPTEFGLLTALTYFSVGRNEISGTLPTELGLMTNLEVFMVADNILSGTLPTELRSMTALETFEVGENPLLTGCLDLGNACAGAPSVSPTVSPTAPTVSPTVSPTAPTASPTNEPTNEPTMSPTNEPTNEPTMSPTGAPTGEPTASPTGAPTGEPTASPTSSPTAPTVSPTGEPIASPTVFDPSLDVDGRNGIMLAAMSGDQTDMATALADAAQFINHMDNTRFGYNALMLAAQYDHQDVVRMLLDADADTGLLTSTDGVENNWSNVMVAAWYGDEEIMKMFLTASTEHLDTVCDYYHMTPLHAAVSRGHSRTTSVLTSFGANVNALDSENMTPLHYAAKSGHFKCAKTLLTAGADKQLIDNAGNTACDYAAEGVPASGAAEGNINHDIQALLGSCAVPP